MTTSGRATNECPSEARREVRRENGRVVGLWQTVYSRLQRFTAVSGGIERKSARQKSVPLP
jgi:hypothetical protein